MGGKCSRQVCRVGFKCREGTHDANHDGHGVRVVLEALKKLNELLMDQRVHCQLPVKGRLLLRRGQLAHEQQVGAVQEIALLCQVLNVITAGKSYTDERELCKGSLS